MFDSLVLLAAGRWTPAAVAAGYHKVLVLQAEMDEGRPCRLVQSDTDAGWRTPRPAA